MTKKTENPFSKSVTRRGRGRKQGHGQAGTAHTGANTAIPLQFATPEQRAAFYEDLSAIRTKEIQLMQIAREMGCYK